MGLTQPAALAQRWIFAWTYSPAGRELTESDPLTGTATSSGGFTYVPLSFTYDAYGQIKTETLPRSFTYQSFAYDAEGANVAWGSSQGLAQQIKYTTRNEASGTSTTSDNQFADGAQCGMSVVQFQPSPVCAMDSRSNLLRSWDATSSGSSQSVNGSPSYTYSFDVNHAFTYDAAGREINDAARTCSITASNDPGTPVSQVPILNSPRTYDAENHITGQTVPAYYEPSSTQCWTGAEPTFANTEVHHYTWGPDAHLAQLSVNAANVTQTSTLGWDGDDLLYTASGNSIASIAIEKLGILASSTTGNANTFSIYDRDWSGGLANVHESGGFSAVNVISLKIPDCTQIVPRSAPPVGGFPGAGFPPPTPAPAPSPTSSPGKTTLIQAASHAACAQGAAAGGPSDPNFTPMIMGYPSIGALREDGYSDGINTFQGVRAYDAAMNQWTTPDAYSGDVHDPMSQKPYMWNGNNAVAYSDPSGYDTIRLVARDAKVFWKEHVFVQVTNDKGHIVKRYSFGSSKEGTGFMGLGALAGKIVQKDQTYDQPFSAKNYGTTVLGSCKGICTVSHGGFDEASLETTAAAINAAGKPYGSSQNSDSAAYTLCANGHGGAKWCHSTGRAR